MIVEKPLFRTWRSVLGNSSKKYGLKRFLLMSFVLFSYSLNASMVPEPCSVAIEGEFLFWTVLTQQDYFARRTNRPSQDIRNEHFLNDHFDYRPAFRIKGFYAFDNCDFLEARFTYFNSTFKSVVTQNVTPGEFISSLFALLGIEVGQIYSKVHMRYYAGDLLLHNFSFQTKGLEISFFEGVHYFWSNFSQHIFGSGFNQQFNGFILTEVAVDAQTWAVGPEFGADFNYVFSCFCGNDSPLDCVSLIGSIKGMALIAHETLQTFAANSFGSNPTTSDSRHFDPDWQVIPGVGAQLGFKWVKRNCSCNIHTEIGYEFLSYPFALTGAGGTGDLQFLSFHGPYAALGINF